MTDGRRKGSAYEREIRDFYRALGWVSAERTPNSGGLAQWPFDLLNVEPLGVECKSDEHISVWAAMAQAIAANDRSGGERLPIVHMKRARRKGVSGMQIVAMPLEVWEEFARAIWWPRCG